MQQHGSSVAISTTFLLNSIGHLYLQALNIAQVKIMKPSVNGGAN